MHNSVRPGTKDRRFCGTMNSAIVFTSAITAPNLSNWLTNDQVVIFSHSLILFFGEEQMRQIKLWMIHQFTLFVLLVNNFSLLMAQPVELMWAKEIGLGDGGSGFQKARLDKNGNIYLIHSALDYYNGYPQLIKVKKNGETAWQRRYGPLNKNNQIPAGFYAVPSAIDIDTNSDIIVTGWGPTGVFILKYDSTGNNLWTENYNADPTSITNGKFISHDVNNNIYVAGEIYKANEYTTRDFFIIKYNAHGDYQWLYRYNGMADREDDVTGFYVDMDGNSYLSGFSQHSNGIDIINLKLKADGSAEWENLKGLPQLDTELASKVNSITTQFMVDSEGNIFATGYQKIYKAHAFGGDIFKNQNNFIAKWNTQGALVWVTKLDSTQIPTKIEIDESNNIVVIGYNDIPDEYGNIKYENFFVQIFDLNGQELNSYKIFNSNSKFPPVFLNYHEKNLYIASGSAEWGADIARINLYKFNLSGVIQWETDYRSNYHRSPGVGFCFLGFDNENKMILVGNISSHNMSSSRVVGIILKYQGDGDETKYQGDGDETTHPSRPYLINYPNPFEKESTFNYFLKTPGKVTIYIYNMLGQHITKIEAENQFKGVNELNWDGTDATGKIVPNGVYICSIQAKGQIHSTKIIVLR